jgi:hypothetical protein
MVRTVERNGSHLEETESIDLKLETDHTSYPSFQKRRFLPRVWMYRYAASGVCASLAEPEVRHELPTKPARRQAGQPASERGELLSDVTSWSPLQLILRIEPAVPRFTLTESC